MMNVTVIDRSVIPVFSKYTHGNYFYIRDISVSGMPVTLMSGILISLVWRYDHEVRLL